jgi:hypothetical protein
VDRRLRPADLAPGDAGITSASWSGISVRSVPSREYPDFADAFARLWAEFGVRGEMEHPDVIAARLAWDPTRPVGDAALLYELLVLRQADQIVAVRDHTAVVRLDERGHARAEPTVVHLSHALIEPAQRGKRARRLAARVAARRRPPLRAGRPAGRRADHPGRGDGASRPE